MTSCWSISFLFPHFEDFSFSRELMPCCLVMLSQTSDFQRIGDGRLLVHAKGKKKGGKGFPRDAVFSESRCENPLRWFSRCDCGNLRLQLLVCEQQLMIKLLELSKGSGSQIPEGGKGVNGDEAPWSLEPMTEQEVQLWRRQGHRHRREETVSVQAELRMPSDLRF